MLSPGSRSIVFVVGMHRSGTSALCAALHASAATFGDKLLDPMSGVNDEGFWEDEAFVELNEALLEQIGEHWYTVANFDTSLDWQAPQFATLAEQAGKILDRGFGPGPVEVVKDPRLCLTLPFWLQMCEAKGIDTLCCVISRSPIDVAQSLARRDGLPVGYGLRLVAAYTRGIESSVPQGSLRVSYEALLANPHAVIETLVKAGLPLDSNSEKLNSAVRDDLRNQRGGGSFSLADDLEQSYPTDGVLRELATALISRGQELTRIGEAHTVALATVVERDQDIAGLGTELQQAIATIAERDQQIETLDSRLAEAGGHLELSLATIDERDQQIREFDRRLTEIGGMHSEALALISARDEQLQRSFAKPGIGLLFKAMWSREQR